MVHVVSAPPHPCPGAPAPAARPTAPPPPRRRVSKPLDHLHGDALPCVLMTSRLSVELTKLAARDSWVPFFPRWLERQLWRGAVNEALAEMQERVASALVGEYEDWSKRPAVAPASE